MLKKNGILLGLIFLVNSAVAQVIDIATLHQNDAQGVPILLNQTVTIVGEVTVSNQFGITGSIQDRTGGVAIYDANFASKVNIGDSVKISGTVTQYSGLTELKNVTILLRVPRAPSVVPKLITCLDVATEGANGVEKLEGQLVRINNVAVNTSKWTVSGAGSNFILTDATGSCEIRIDKDTDLSNTSAPAARFDVIGVIQQYDPESPYTQGYQLLPRFKADVIDNSVLDIVSGPVEKNILPYSMDLTWQTQSATNSIVIYGKTSNYEIDTIVVQESVKNHLVHLAQLWPATLYHVRVGAGTNGNYQYSADRIVMSASNPSSTGKMNVYFNQSVDPGYAQFGVNAEKANLLNKLGARIEGARYSIDFCFYFLDEAAGLLVGAFQRGVKVRVIYDYDSQRPGDSDAVQFLKNANVPIINDRFGDNNGNAAMHNKFMIVDHRDTTSAADDWVWTGSYNATESARLYNAENVIEIQDQALAECYTIEFNEMWGSDRDAPDPAKSRFGYRKTENTPHRFNINGVEVLQYMSPSDHGQEALLAAIEQAQHALYFCMLTFNQSSIANAMYGKWKTVPEFKIKGVIDGEDLSGSQYYNLIGTGSQPWNPPADVHLDKEAKYLHHKYLIIDGDGRSGNSALVTGSYNWSNAAENSNDENFLIIKSPLIANLYLQEFAERYHKAGGTQDLTLTSVAMSHRETMPGSALLAQNYPNPFNGQTQIRIEVAAPTTAKLEIFNAIGQIIRSFDLVFQVPGSHEVMWDARDHEGHAVAAGVYFYRLRLLEPYKTMMAQKMIHLP
ncbi:MAG: phospholipase D-like domain-containing protein [candidate division KSB1 bacterium]|nr:phospholipase D-like domain-containing protein [candidate division KSB1 bacterium]MDZ7318931.1 phospholipase D-like domain-containing protein [candidate division KSB1 bacterium]MDZ7340130.1 phospholipase D-like domain-containing protein [candidate division KSB1 bacterium]